MMLMNRKAYESENASESKSDSGEEGITGKRWDSLVLDEVVVQITNSH